MSLPPAVFHIAICIALLSSAYAGDRQFAEVVEPLLQDHCVDCHSADNMESGIRVDHLDGKLNGRTPFLWSNIRKQLAKHAMPPEDELQPSDEVRAAAIEWIDNALLEAKRRPREKNGSVRRLTVAQYQNTLSDLLGIDDDFTSLLPPDAVTKDGFRNQEQTMVLSPLLIEAYFEVADRALDIAIVDPKTKPQIQNFRVELGQSINPLPCPDKLILGANSHLLNNADFTVKQLKADKPFDFYPFWMKTKYRFIEGYQGNSTVRGWKNYDSIYHAVFACMRGNRGYPKGNAFDLVPEGLLLRPAIPSSLLFGKQSTYGPRANFKIALRELPDRGRFRVTVKASRYDDALLLKRDTPPVANDDSIAVDFSDSAEANVVIPGEGMYQVDVSAKPEKELASLKLTLRDRQFAAKLNVQKSEADAEDKVTASFLQVRLPAGPLRVTARYKDKSLGTLSLTRLDETHDKTQAFLKFEERIPTLGVHLGLRRDCGHTLTAVGERYRVGDELDEFVFEGAINNFPSPDVEKDNVNYLAGVREIGVRQEFTDGRDMPRLLIRSVEFEGPLYESWPPASHQAIFIGDDPSEQSADYARMVIKRFATRAYRRPVTDEELESLEEVWRDAFEQSGDFLASVKDALLVVLTSPQFLFQIESSESPGAEPISDFELASKLSYFLWDAPPDRSLLLKAKEGSLRSQLDDEFERMARDERFASFAKQFATQWLSLEKLDTVGTDLERFPQLISEVKRELQREPVELLLHLARENLPLKHLVKSDFVMANEVVANYYGFGERVETGFEFVALKHDNERLGGLLSQAGILAALSDGREPNPVKRGAWLARKILAEPPDDPPPNVPELTADDPSLSLRERLELHRNQPGCAKCHEGIDPWGLPLEEFDAGGRYKKQDEEHRVDASSTLPDDTNVRDANALKDYLANDRIDQVAFSFLKHVAMYATGRELSYNEIEFLRDAGLECKPTGYRVRDLMRLVVTSPLFLEK